MLSDDEIEKMHEKTLGVLEKVGVKITHSEALGKFEISSQVVP